MQTKPFHSTGIILNAPPRARAPAVLEFAAPIGRRVRGIMIFVGFAVGAATLGDFWLVFTRQMPAPTQVMVLLAPVLVIGVGAAIISFSQVCGYRLTGDTLEIPRRHCTNSFPLAGLTYAATDPGAMSWSINFLGNDGLGAIVGWYRNKRLGNYRAFVTDPQRLVVLRWLDRCVVISPDRPEEFVAVVRERAGLRN